MAKVVGRLRRRRARSSQVLIFVRLVFSINFPEKRASPIKEGMVDRSEMLLSSAARTKNMTTKGIIMFKYQKYHVLSLSFPNLLKIYRKIKESPPSSMVSR